MAKEQKRNYAFPDKGINRYVSDYIKKLPDLSGKIVLDIPCGDGRATYEFIRKGATVKAFDLFPDFMTLKEVSAQYADLNHALPIDSNSVDYIICQEGIEHAPNQLKVLEEFNRVLKKDGLLLVTTPNYSHVRARLTDFFLESDYWSRMPPTEIDSVWFADKDSDNLYFGHLFLLGVQHFQTILSIAGFRVDQRIKTGISNTSLVSGVLLYPLFIVTTILACLMSRKKNPHVTQAEKDHILWERLKLNLSPKTLFCKHIFWILSKELECGEVAEKLKKMSRK